MKHLGIIATVLIALAGCSSAPSPSATSSAPAVASDSIIGKWRINDPHPKPTMLGAKWTALDFIDGTHVALTATAAPLFAGMMDRATLKKALQPHTKTFDYDVPAPGKIRIDVDSDAETFVTEIKGDRLYLTQNLKTTGNAKMDAFIAANQPTVIYVRVK